MFALARRWGVRTLMLECRATPDVIRERLQARHGDASDADWAIYRQAAGEWQAPDPASQRLMRVIDTTNASSGDTKEALGALRSFGLADPESA
jgi:predicted kinase